MGDGFSMGSETRSWSGRGTVGPFGSCNCTLKRGVTRCPEREDQGKRHTEEDRGLEDGHEDCDRESGVRTHESGTDSTKERSRSLRKGQGGSDGLEERRHPEGYGGHTELTLWGSIQTKVEWDWSGR